MIIDKILDRKDVDEDSRILVSDYKSDDLHVRITSLYPVDEIPEQLRNGYTYHYTAAAFYREIVRYGAVGHGITAAMDYGTEEDVKRALCDYIDKNEYNPEIKEYINSVNWLEV